MEEALLGEDYDSARDEQREAVGLGHVLDGVALARVEAHDLSRIPGGDQLLELEPRHGHRLEHLLVGLLQHGVEIDGPQEVDDVQELSAVEKHEGEVPRKDVGIAGVTG